jgi:hypothetical protein
MNASSEFNLDLVERRGTIFHCDLWGNLKRADGWFMLTLDGRGVVRRKVGGRNRSLFCSVESVISFDLFEVKVK